MDFWSEVGPHSEQVDLMVEPSQVSKVNPYMSHCQIYVITKANAIVLPIPVLSFQVARVTAYLRNSGIDYQVS